MWAVTLSAEHRLTSIVVPTYPEASDGRTPIAGDLVILRPGPASTKSNTLKLVEAGQIEIEAWQRALPREAPARIVVFRLCMHNVAQLLPSPWRSKLEIDFDDYESHTQRSLAWLAFRHFRIGKALTYLATARRFASFESRAATSYGRVHVAAREDAAPLATRFPNSRIVIAANRIAGPATAIPRGSRIRNSILFVGTLSYLPNEDAVRWLARDIWPRLRRLVPEAKVVIAGAAPTSLIGVMRRAGLQYAGPLLDLHESYEQAAIAAAPLRGGGGTKVKVLEAWAHGCPVVATSHAARGLGAVHGEHLLIADTPESFANSCAALLRNPGLGDRLAANAVALLNRHFILPENNTSSAFSCTSKAV